MIKKPFIRPNEKELYKSYLREKHWIEKHYPCYYKRNIISEDCLVNYNTKRYII